MALLLVLVGPGYFVHPLVGDLGGLLGVAGPVGWYVWVVGFVCEV